MTRRDLSRYHDRLTLHHLDLDGVIQDPEFQGLSSQSYAWSLPVSMFVAAHCYNFAMTEKTRPLTATDLSRHYHYNCDLYLHNAHRRRQPSESSSSVCLPELFAAQFHRGNTWENILLTWLEQENLLLRVPSRPTDPVSLAANVEFDDRSHFFIAGLTFWPPQDILDSRFEAGTLPVKFGLAKPDLIEIVRTEAAVKWRVIDAKSSIGMKVSYLVYVKIGRFLTELTHPRHHTMYKYTFTLSASDIY